ncbi:hypothetical protein [Costertonia aggregata]|uniref:Glycosyltransferase n=1 Tax=Costertonia aggregata TaxID=343403 RepID=A0A7H9ASE0_9FLAO|nr:hypothetical protein [Costertonia aggregata]QLG46327.1 hypothetical protein HYG79_13540 [Costertonia aggregata]
MKKKALLIELNTYHEECLYSQITFLKNAGYWVGLAIHPALEQSIQPYKSEIDTVYTSKNDSKVFFIYRIYRVLKLYFFILKTNSEIIVFNTASSKKEVIVLSYLLRKKRLFGILHNIKKLNTSLSQKIICKNIKKYFVLNDFLLEKARESNPKLCYSSFYPIFFYDYEMLHEYKKNETWVTIPGKIEFSRRDYNFIVDILKELSRADNLKIILLGKLSSDNTQHNELQQNIDSFGLTEHFILFDRYIENPEFHGYIKSSDYILIPIKEVDTKYQYDKIMGAYNLAFAYKKTLICPKGLEHFDDIKNNAILYNGKDGLSKVLEAINNNENRTGKTAYHDRKWTFEEQQKKYISFIEA